MKKITKRDHKLDLKGNPKLEKQMPKKEWNPAGNNDTSV